jgi:spore germination protein GerM
MNSSIKNVYYLIGFLFLLFLFILVLFNWKSEKVEKVSELPTDTDQVVLTADEVGTEEHVIRLYTPTDGDEDNCEATNYEIHVLPDSDMPERAVIELLLESGLLNNPKEFRLLNASLDDSVLTLEFNQVPGFTSGGSCMMSMIKSQISKTGNQFNTVDEVRILPIELFEP